MGVAGSRPNGFQCVVTRRAANDSFGGDILGVRGESLLETPPSRDIVEDSDMDPEFPSLSTVLDRTRDQLERLPEEYRRLRGPATYPVSVSDALEERTTATRLTVEVRMNLRTGDH